MRLNGQFDTQPDIISRGPRLSSSPSASYQLKLLNSNILLFSVSDNPDNPDANSGIGYHTLPPPGQFFHFAATFSDSSREASLYINGSEVARHTLSRRPYTNYAPSNYALGIMATPTRGYVSAPFNGSLDELSLYNRPLSPAEIQSIYNAGNAETGGTGKCFQEPAPATVTGRVTTPSGAALRNATVTLTHPDGIRLTATTSSFGIYSFNEVPNASNYTVSVSSKRYRFAPRVLSVSGNLANVDFVGLE